MAADRAPTKVAARCGCGRPVETGHRYCPDCGSLVGHLAGESDGVDLGVGSGDPSVLLGPVAGPRRDVAGVQTGRSSLGYRLLAIGAAVVVVLLAWGLFRQPSDEVVPEPAENEEESASDDASGDQRAGADASEDDRTGTDSATTGRSTTTAPLAAAEVAPGAPLLGEETGLTLVSQHGTGIQLLDLDDGTVTEIDPVIGQPVATLGSTLITQQQSDLYLLDLSDPQAEAIMLLGDETSGWVNLVDVADGLIWVQVSDSSGQQAELRAYDEHGRLQGGRFGRQLGASPARFGRVAGGLAWSAGGGIYRREGDTYHRVSTGYLLAAGDELALISECGDTLDCRWRWVDIATWTDISYPAPPVNDLRTGYRIVGSDRWLAALDWDTDEVQLLDISTGESVYELPGRLVGSGGLSIPISDDGRWLVDPSRRNDGDPVIVALDSGAEWPLPERTGWGAALFVESSAIQSSSGESSSSGEADG